VFMSAQQVPPFLNTMKRAFQQFLDKQAAEAGKGPPPSSN
jgi:hypothetical protein